MIRNDLGRVAETGSMQVPSLFEIERYPTVWQMTSTVTATSQRSVAEILTAMFPCASITGAPKIRTTHIIASLETTPRRIYTGCIGFIAPGQTAQFNVAIRTVLIDRENHQAEYGVGGGIVWDSTEQEEYAECLTKAHLLSGGWPEFSLLEALLWSPEAGYFLLDYHIRRLTDSGIYFGFPLDKAGVLEKLSRLAESLPGEVHKVQLRLASDGEITCRASPLTAVPKPPLARLRLSPKPVDSTDLFLYHKTTHRQVYEVARKACPDCDDVLLWNERGEITESDTANVVVELDGERVTPPVSCGLLGGTFRRWLLDQGDIHERVVPVDDLPRCSKIYLINSVRKWREVTWVP
jgi:para-aminobenzoate synthetase/4-amino-4-deoxychorismate lyase